MTPTVYLDSTVPSYYLEPRDRDPIIHSRHLVTRRWWEQEMPSFEPFVSQVVLDELSRGDAQRAARRLQLVEDFQRLPVNVDVQEAAHFYAKHFAMPKKNLRDALHLALASVHRIEYLVTWNLAHLANAKKRIHFEALNHMLHLASPVICTPEELLFEDEAAEEKDDIPCPCSR